MDGAWSWTGDPEKRGLRGFRSMFHQYVEIDMARLQANRIVSNFMPIPTPKVCWTLDFWPPYDLTGGLHYRKLETSPTVMEGRHVRCMTVLPQLQGTSIVQDQWNDGRACHENSRIEQASSRLGSHPQASSLRDERR